MTTAPPARPSIPTTPPRSRRYRGAVVVLGGLLLCASIGCGYLYHLYQRTSDKNPLTEKHSLISDIGQHILLPQEDPVVATVQDKHKLSNKALAQKAEAGDRLLIYGKAKRIILYRPSNSKVIDVFAIR